MQERLFVYGTLAPGRTNEHKLTHLGGSWQEASIKGLLQNKGWGAKMGYPGLILDPNAKSIQGFLLTSDKLQTEWANLDAFEGEEYMRTLTSVTCQNGEIVDAYVYVLRT